MELCRYSALALRQASRLVSNPDPLGNVEEVNSVEASLGSSASILPGRRRLTIKADRMSVLYLSI